MRAYLDILQDILDHGQWKENRTGIRCLTSPCPQFFIWDMKWGFPLVTTRKMPFRSICVELEGFIKGITSKKWFEDRGCKFWSHWCNPFKLEKDWYYDCEYHGDFTPMTEEERKYYQKHEDDLGPLGYSFGWRRFGETYDEDDDGVIKGFDQLKYVVDTLKTDPNNRRMVVSAWNPNHLSRTAMPACPLIWGVTHLNGTLSLNWSQRSSDAFIGGQNDTASYALLLLLLCKESGLKPGYLSGHFWDCHIYENHVEAVKEQLTRPIFVPPQLEILDNKKGGFSIFDWEHCDVNLHNYKCHPKISAPIAI